AAVEERVAARRRVGLLEEILGAEQPRTGAIVRLDRGHPGVVRGEAARIDEVRRGKRLGTRAQAQRAVVRLSVAEIEADVQHPSGLLGLHRYPRDSARHLACVARERLT